MPYGYLTPEEIPATLTRRWFCFPNDPYILAAVNGALLELTYPYNWELFGAITPEEIAAAMIQPVLDFQATEALCMPTLHVPVVFFDQKTQNTAGGTATSGAWQTRTLNTMADYPEVGASLSSNEFTLPAGKWYFKWRAPALYVLNHQTRLFSVTENTPIWYGMSAHSATNKAQADVSEGAILQNNSEETTYRLEHRVQQTRSTDGWGSPANLATEIYAMVECFPVS